MAEPGADFDVFVMRRSGALTYRIDFGDGTSETDSPDRACHDPGTYWPSSSYGWMTDPNPAVDAWGAMPTHHEYAEPGTYTVTITVTSTGCDGRDAQTSSSAVTVTVESSWPSPSPSPSSSESSAAGG